MRLIGAVALVLLLTACGSTGGTSDRHAAPLAPSHTAAPVEAADCRAALSTVGQVLDSMDRPSLDYGVFVDQFHRLGAMRKRAGTTCSGQVMRPLSLSVYKLSLVNAKWSTCTRPACVSGLYDKIQTAITQGRDAVQAAQRTA